MLKNITLFLSFCLTLLLFGCQPGGPNGESEIISSSSIKTSASPNQMNIIEIQDIKGTSHVPGT